jgi:hypothetical protein
MIFVFFPVFVVCIVGFSLFIFGFEIKEALLCSGYVLLIMVSIFSVEMPLMFRRQRKIKAFIYNDKIVKQCGRHENSISWQNVVQIKIRENNKGEIVNIQIQGNDKTSILLFGLNEMRKLSDLVRERLPGDALVKTKKNRFDLRIHGIIAAVGTFFFMAIITSFGDKAKDIFAVLAAFGTSLFLFLYKPLGKSDAGLKWIEIILSLILLLLGIYGFISSFIYGHF